MPDGAVVVLFPSNLTVAMETGRHPVLGGEGRMHYKRKVVAPGPKGPLVHRLEWRFYVRRKRGGARVVERVGQRMRVGAERRLTHVGHAGIGGAGRDKVLMVCLTHRR